MWYYEEGDLESGSGMMRKANRITLFILIAVGVLLAFGSFVQQRRLEGGEARVGYGERSPAIVKLTSFHHETNREGMRIVAGIQGSGICISEDGYILTAEHCVRDHICTPFIEFPGGIGLNGQVLHIDPHSDRAVLKVETSEPLPWVSVASTFPRSGDRVYCQGFPDGVFKETPTTVSRVCTLDMLANAGGGNSRDARNVESLEIFGAVQHGNSGGGIFNDRGELIGIMSHVSHDRRSFTYGCGVSECQSAAQYCGIGLKKAFGKSEKSLPKAYCLWDKDCPPCLQFITDFGGKNPGKHPPRSPELRQFIDSFCRLHFVKINNAKKLCKKYGVTGKPAFLISCCDRPLIGYNGPQDLMNRIQAEAAKGGLTTATEFEVGTDSLVQCQADAWFNNDPDFFAVDLADDGTLAQSPPQSRGLFPFRRQVEVKTPSQDQPQAQRQLPKAADVPESELQGTPMTPPDEKEEPAEPTPIDPDLSDITAVILVKKSVSGIAGQLIGYVEEHAKGKLSDAVDEALKGKASVKLVFERSESQKYAAIMEAAGMSGDKPGAVLLLAPKKFDGIAGNLIGIVEKKLSDLTHSALKNLPVSAVFERTEEDSYSAIVEALGTESKPSAGGLRDLTANNPATWSLAGLSGMAVSFLALFKKLFGRSDKLASKIASLEKRIGGGK